MRKALFYMSTAYKWKEFKFFKTADWSAQNTLLYSGQREESLKGAAAIEEERNTCSSKKNLLMSLGA